MKKRILSLLMCLALMFGFLPGGYPNVVQASASDTYTASANPGTVNFAQASAGYTSTEQAVTVINTGTGILTGLTASLSGTNSGSFTISSSLSSSSISTGGSATIGISTVSGITAGTYSAVLTISGDHSFNLLIPVSFTVTSGSTIVVNGTAPYTLNNAGLTAAITAANAGDTIDIQGNITLTAAITVNKPVTITSSSGKKLIRGGANFPLMNITGGSAANPVVLSNITLDGVAELYGNSYTPNSGLIVFVGNSACFMLSDGGVLENNNVYNLNGTSVGGAVFVNGGGSFIMYGGTITRNSANGYGGGVYIDDSGTFTMNGGSVYNNASGDGGGIYINGSGSFTMNGGTVGSNSAVEYGGGILVNGSGSFTMNGGTVSSNKVTYHGGGIAFIGSGSSLTINGGTLSSNGGMGMYGGGVYVGGSARVTMNGGTIDGGTQNDPSHYSGNAWNGGGVYVDESGCFNLKNGTISKNAVIHISNSDQYQGFGGGVYVKSGSFIMDGGAISENTADVSGAGVCVSTTQTVSGTFIMNGGEISNNSITGQVGSGGVCVAGGSFTLNDGSIKYNTSKGFGGAVNVSSGSLNMNGGSISNNTTDTSGFGGGVYLGYNSTFNMTNGSISNNFGGQLGGGVDINGSASMVMSGGSISGNTATNSGGGVYDSGSLTMTGGSITGNCATASVQDGGGGVLFGVDSVGKFYVSGSATVTGNTQSNGGSGQNLIVKNTNVYGGLVNQYSMQGMVFVTGPLTGSIGLTPAMYQTSPQTKAQGSSYTITDADAACFFSDDPQYNVIHSGNNVVFTKTPTAPAITTTSLPNGVVGTAYSQVLSASGTTPIAWSLVSGSLPAGLNLNASTGAITGTPTSAGTSTFTVKASSSVSPYATKALSITVTLVPTYSVTGAVTDTVTNKTVAGATITLTNKSDSTKTYTATADANGSFTVSGLPNGSYWVTVTKNDVVYTVSNNTITVNNSNISGKGGNISAAQPTYTVSYNGNGCDSGSTPADGSVYIKGSDARVMSCGNLAKAGFLFNGWNTSSTGSGTSYKVNDTITVTGNVILYAQWKTIDGPQIPIITFSNVRGVDVVSQPGPANQLSVNALVYDGGNVTYQWYECAADTTAGGVAISVATSSSYTPSASTTGTAYYFVVVTNTKVIGIETKTATNISSIKEVIVLAGPPANFAVSTDPSLFINITIDNPSAEQYQDYATTISADTGYILPDNITVKMDGRILVPGVDYIYSKTSSTTGAVTVYNVTGEVDIKAIGVPIPTQTYTIFFDSNGADTPVNAISGTCGAVLVLPTPVKTGYNFAGWYLDSGFATSYTSRTFDRDAVTLYAKWQGDVYGITGNVKDEDNAVVGGAAVKLMAGSRQVAQANTDGSGNFSITGVPTGTYNLVISKGNQTITLVITVSSSDIATGTVTLPRGNKNSVIEVTQNTPDIVVDKLNDYFSSDKFTQDDSNVVDSGGTVEIKLLAEKKDESGGNAASNADSITASAGGDGKTVGMFLNLTVSKIITPSGGTPEQPVLIDQLADLLIINIPLPSELQGLIGYVIYRYHGSVVQTITETPNSDGEYIELSADGKSIILHTKKFSTYALGYTATSTPPAGGSGGGSNSSALAPAISVGPSVNGKIDISIDEKTAAITPDEGYLIADVIVDGNSVGATDSYSFTSSGSHKINAIFVEDTALPYYIQDGGKVYIGFSNISGKLYKYIAPAGVTIGFSENPKSFTDNTIAWAKPSIDFVAEREIFVGTGPDRFSPEVGMTRAMFVSVIGRMYERSYGSISGTSSFIDVDENAYYARYVAWANENGIIKGIGDNKFAPDDLVTREQMAVILLNLATFMKKAETSYAALAFDDSKSISLWAVDGAKYCQNAKIISGRNGSKFAPQDSASRAEVAAVIERFIKLIVK